MCRCACFSHSDSEVSSESLQAVGVLMAAPLRHAVFHAPKAPVGLRTPVFSLLSLVCYFIASRGFFHDFK